MSLLKELRGHEGDVNHCQWSPRESLLCSAGGDKVIRLWDPVTGQEHPSSPLKGHSYYVNVCVLSPGGDLLASASSDYTVKLWSTATWNCIGTLNGHNGPVRMCSFSPDGALIATASGDYSVRVWEVNSMNCISVLNKHDCSVQSCSFAPVGWLLATGGTSGEIVLFDIFSKKCKQKTLAHDLGVNWVEFSPVFTDKLLLATAGQDNKVKLWNVLINGNAVTIQLHATLLGHSRPVYSCQYSPSLDQLVSGSADNTFIIWDIATCRAVTKIEAHSRYVTFCCYSPDGTKLVSTSNDKTIRIWTSKPSTVEDSKSVSSVTSSASSSLQSAMPSKDAVDSVCEWLAGVRMSGDPTSQQEQCLLDKLTKALKVKDDDVKGSVDLKCPITQEVFKDPVVASDGFTYERSAIMSWLSEGKRTSPVTNLPLANTILTPNNTLKRLIDSS